MGEKDITEKILEDHNDVFADIINGLIFAGEQRILPESLENTAVHSQYKADDEKVHELERDVAKYWKDQDVQLAICGIENQSSVEKYMPFRIIGYDGTAYRSQLQDKRKEILPVMTIVLYFGTEHCWYGKRNIKGLMKIPEGLDDYINDYKMQVFEVAWLTEEQISRFRSDFKIVANFFVQKRKNKDYIPDDPTEIKHIDEVLKLLQVMTGDEHYKEVIRKKKGELQEMAKGDDRILFTGFVQGQELDELYSNAYVYTLPSDLEGMPLSLLEAMSYGNCCLVSDIEECASVVEDKALVFKKADVNDLREKLQTVCEKEDVVQKRKEEAADFICEKYNWDDVVRRTLKLYRR